MLLSCMIVYITDYVCMSNGMREWNRRLAVGRILCDYPVVMDEEADWDALNKAGLYESDLLFVKGVKLADKKVYSDKNIQLLVDNAKKHVDIKYIYDEICRVMKYGSVIWFFVIGCILFGIFNWDWKVFAVYTGMLTACSLYFLITGRAPARVIESLMFVGTLNAIICAVYTNRKKTQNKLFRYVLYSGALGIAILLIARGNLRTLFNKKVYEYTHYISENEMKLIDGDKEHIYIMPLDFFVSLAIQDNLFYNYETDFCENVLYWSGWFQDLPCFQKIMRQNNVKDPMDAMYNNDNVYTMYREDILNFLKLHYGEFDINHVCKLGNIEIVQYKSISEKY